MRDLPAIFTLFALLGVPQAAGAQGGAHHLLRARSSGIALYEGVAQSGPLDQRFSAAAMEFEKAWRQSRDPRDRFNWGLALLRGDASARAKPELEAVARSRPRDPAPLYALAVLAIGQSDWKGAIRQLDKVLKIESRYLK